MENKTLTAVEWLFEQLPIRMKNYLQEEIIKAKEMEKEQIIYGYSAGVVHALKQPDKIDAPKYYDENYGKGPEKI